MTTVMQKMIVILISSLLLLGNNNVVESFYIPGVNPHSFAEGDVVKLKVNKMTSTKTQFPLNYYSLPFCAPVDGAVMDNENLGEFLEGDRIESSPYLLLMKKDMYCEQLCKSQLGKPQTYAPITTIGGKDGRDLPTKGIVDAIQNNGNKVKTQNKVIRAIIANYHNNWIVDNLSAASKVEDDNQIMTKYSQGFPIGFIAIEEDPATQKKEYKTYINNHVNLEIMYHAVENENNKYRIVRFTVEPFSIGYDADFVAMSDGGRRDKTHTDDDDDSVFDIDENDPDGYLPPVAKLYNPIISCDPKVTNKNPEIHHTSYDMIMSSGTPPQLASGEVLFTYDVIWTENKDLHWASRWDIYLSGIAPAKVHWETIIFSLVVVMVLSAMVAAILVRNLRRDLARYSKLPTSDEEKADELEEFGWKLVHGDVFRPPNFSPMLLSICCGTGAQIFCMTFLTIVISALGLLNPSERGALVMGELILFVLCGAIAGYITARYYKTFKGKEWQKATMLTALSFPGICFTFFFILNLVAWSQDSTDKVPFATMVVLVVLWFGISTPLVFLGAYYGYKQDAIEFPVNTSSIPRPIPEQQWFTSVTCTVMISGILPFGSCFVELYYILSSVWMEYYYYMFGFLFLVFFILAITCAEITMLFTYFQLCAENYHWWWRSFLNAGFSAVYVFMYSIIYFSRLEANTISTYVLYFGYMGLISLGMFLMMGFIGTTSSLIFNKTIFASIKID